MIETLIEFSIAEISGFDRIREPITHGVPFPTGKVWAKAPVHITDQEDRVVWSAVTPLAWWGDGSVKWMLVDLQLDLHANEAKTLYLKTGHPHKAFTCSESQQLSIDTDGPYLSVDTGNVSFDLDSTVFLPFRRVSVNGRKILDTVFPQFILKDENGKACHPQIEHLGIETNNALRLVIRFDGSFAFGKESHPLTYSARLHFFAGNPTVRLDFTLWNPRAARHLGGLWDLGDENSILFKELKLALPFIATGPREMLWKIRPFEKCNTTKHDNLTQTISIYQDSSGG